MIDVIPGIFEKEWNQVERKIALVAPYVDWVQIEISDGTLVPAISLLKFVKPASPAGGLDQSLSFEAHLMVADPVKYIRSLADAGFKRLIAHIECQDPRDFLDQTKYESIEACLSIDAPTEFEQIEPFLEEVDGVLVMTAEAGEAGRVFQPETVEKIRLIRQNFIDLPIEVEGGINNVTAKITIEAGATRLVSSSYLFNDPDNIASAIERLKTS
ncbi:MAG: hypothetical protein AAB961_00905 [Patescibacteria group bacterium]